MVAEYAAWVAEQPLSQRTREAYLAAITAFAGWLEERGGVGEAFVVPLPHSGRPRQRPAEHAVTRFY